MKITVLSQAIGVVLSLSSIRSERQKRKNGGFPVYIDSLDTAHFLDTVL